MDVGEMMRKWGDVMREWADVPFALTSLFVMLLCMMLMVPMQWLCKSPEGVPLFHTMVAFFVSTALTIGVWWLRVAALKPVPIVHDFLKLVGIRGDAYTASGKFEWTYIFHNRKYSGWLWSVGSFALTVVCYLLLLASIICAIILARTPEISEFIMNFSTDTKKMRPPKMLFLVVAFCAAYRAVKIGNNKMISEIRKEVMNHETFEDGMLVSTWVCLGIFVIVWCRLMVWAWHGLPPLKPHIIVAGVATFVIAVLQIFPPLWVQNT